METDSPSFAARHDAADADAAMAVLDSLERFRDELSGVFERTPGEIAVVLHPSPLMLSIAQPWLPLARRAAAPAGRRYFTGWFSRREIHVLSPHALERRASGSPGSRDALMLAPRHEYAHLVLGANNPDLPPPFTVGSFRRYLRWAWLCEGGATYFAGQVPHLRAAIVRRLREGGRPDFPPSARDAALLGGTLFSVLADMRGERAAIALSESRLSADAGDLLEDAFDRPLPGIERAWRDELDALRAS